MLHPFLKCIASRDSYSSIAGKRRPKQSRTALGRRLGFEALEQRNLMTVFAGPSAVAVPLYEELTKLSSNGTLIPSATSGPTGYTPAQIRHAYGFDQIAFGGGTVAGDGSGQTIAIVDAYNDPNIASDLHQFDLAFGLPDPVFTKVNQNGGTSMPQADAGWAAEIALDVEWAHAIAPQAKILLVEANDASYANLLAAVNYARNAAGVVAVSMSWGGGEFNGESNYDSYFTTPSGHSGVAFVVASGDSGAPAEYPAASPNVLSVGGTALYLSSQGTISSETAWSGSTGGLSTFESEPAYQKGVVTQTTTRRATPDVSYDSDPNTGFGVYDSYGTSAPWGQYGGTSDAAPQWAALIAIADQGRALAGLPALSGTQLLTNLYQLPAGDFHDVASGSSRGNTTLSATSGFDLVTGRGTPQANLIVSALVGSASSTATATRFGLSAPGSATAGGTFSITVSALTSSNTVFTGYTGTVHFSSSDVAAGLPADYTFTSADNGVHTFAGLTLKTAGSQSLVVADKLTGTVTGSTTVLVNPAAVHSPATTGSSVIEAFESGLGAYHAVGANSGSASVSTSAAHDGTSGLLDANGNDWIYRNDAAAQVKRGDTISTWVQFSGSADGRAYFGFGASSAGTLSLVAAANTKQLILQSNTSYTYVDVATASQTWLPNHWYRLDVDWGASGKIVGRLFDSNGTTLLQTVSGSSTVTSGGIAFRGFGSNKLWDTVSVSTGVNGFSVASSTIAPSNSSIQSNSPIPSNSLPGDVRLASAWQTAMTMALSSAPPNQDSGAPRATALFQQGSDGTSTASVQRSPGSALWADAKLAPLRLASWFADDEFSDNLMLDESTLETVAQEIASAAAS